MSKPNAIASRAIKFALLLTSGISLSCPHAVGQDKLEPPDPIALAKRGVATLSKLENSPASWTAVHDTGQADKRFRVAITHADVRRRVSVSFTAPSTNLEVVDILMTDGLWFVKEEGKFSKYRAWEAPLQIHTVYIYVHRSDIRCLTDPILLNSWKYVSTERGVALYQSPVPERLGNQMRKMLQEVEEHLRNNPGKDRTSLDASMKKTKDLLRDGVPMRVDLDTGILLESGIAENHWVIQDFKWIDQVPKAIFAAPEAASDHSQDMTAGDLNDLVMVSHSPVWRPGTKMGDGDIRILNTRTGELRRVPFQGIGGMPGCFLKDRTKVVIVGLADEGALCLYEVNLRTGANRPLGGSRLSSGFTLMPACSPDGTRLIANHRGEKEGMLTGQFVLVDLASGEAKDLGSPIDGSSPSWLPDGTAIVFERHDRKAGDDALTRTICQMSLNGDVKPLKQGQFPAVMGNRILFGEDNLWKTCDLSGQDTRLLGDGISKHVFPSPSPDGKKLIMIRAGEQPKLVIITLEPQGSAPATSLPGLWKFPVWR